MVRQSAPHAKILTILNLTNDNTFLSIKEKYNPIISFKRAKFKFYICKPKSPWHSKIKEESLKVYWRRKINTEKKVIDKLILFYLKSLIEDQYEEV